MWNPDETYGHVSSTHGETHGPPREKTHPTHNHSASRLCLSPQLSIFYKDMRTLTSVVTLSNDMQSDGRRISRDATFADVNTSEKVDDEDDGRRMSEDGEREMDTW